MSELNEAAEPVPGERAGDWIGRYQLVEPVGEGGMGTVWKAQQSEPVQRQVALKIIKLGMDTKEVVARFETERQVLAMLDHPHVAKVFDGGATEGGRPYFVMELVSGTPLTRYCDQAQLSLTERLHLFIKVCGAIQHAHHKGVIHRDIKPSNVLVTEQDGEIVPKVIDFGIAKATASAPAHQTLLTEIGQIMGTPEYMSPEQAGASNLDVDTRSDVYALGVVLYELLTGSKAFDLHKALELGYAELLRQICEVDPPRPSTRISTLQEDSRIVAVRRISDVNVLEKRLRGDLDWIVMKALEKDRARRYGSPAELAADIERYLNHESVLAAPPSMAYRLRKFVVRRKKTVMAMGAIGALFLAGSIGTGVGWWRTQQANQRLDTANRELGQVVEFLAAQLSGIDVPGMGNRLRSSLLEEVDADHRDQTKRLLGPVNFTNLALRALDENILSQTHRAIEAQFGEQPAVRAHLLNTLGKTLHALGLQDQAVGILESAFELRKGELGAEDAKTLDAQVDLGIALGDTGQLERAKDVLAQALSTDRRVLGDAHPQTAAVLNALGHLSLASGAYPEAELAFAESLELMERVHGDRSREYATAAAALGGLHLALGRLDQAEPLLNRSLALHEELYPETDANYLAALNQSAALWRAQGHLEKAEEAMLRGYESTRAALGDNHPDTLMSLGNVGYIHYGKGRFDEAEACFAKISGGYMEAYGEAHPETLQAMGDLAAVQQAVGKLEESVSMTRRIVDIAQRELGPKHRTTLIQTNNLSHGLEDLGRIEEALPLAKSYYEGVQDALPDDRERLANAAYHLGQLSLRAGEYAQAESALRHLQSIRTGDPKAQDWRAQNLRTLLGLAIAHQGRFEEAEGLILEGAEALIADPEAPNPDSPQGDVAAQAIQRVIDFYGLRAQAHPEAGYAQKAEEWKARLQSRSSREAR